MTFYEFKQFFPDTRRVRKTTVSEMDGIDLWQKLRPFSVDWERV